MGFWIPWAVFWIPDSTSKILLSSRFHKQKFPGFHNPDSLTRGELLDNIFPHHIVRLLYYYYYTDLQTAVKSIPVFRVNDGVPSWSSSLSSAAALSTTKTSKINRPNGLKKISASNGLVQYNTNERGSIHEERNILAPGRSQKVHHPSTTFFLYSVYMQKLYLSLKLDSSLLRGRKILAPCKLLSLGRS